MLIVIKVLLNVFLFIFYLVVGIIFGNFLYGFILNSSGKLVPGSGDPVHMKIALGIFIIVSLFTLVFRKFFYSSLGYKKKINTEEKISSEINEYLPKGINDVPTKFDDTTFLSKSDNEETSVSKSDRKINRSTDIQKTENKQEKSNIEDLDIDNIIENIFVNQPKVTDKTIDKQEAELKHNVLKSDIIDISKDEKNGSQVDDMEIFMGKEIK